MPELIIISLLSPASVQAMVTVGAPELRGGGGGWWRWRCWMEKGDGSTYGQFVDSENETSPQSSAPPHTLIPLSENSSLLDA
ncbi:hypothetical protein QQ045_027134 [Rhodiola kirilowii]